MLQHFVAISMRERRSFTVGKGQKTIKCVMPSRQDLVQYVASHGYRRSTLDTLSQRVQCLNAKHTPGQISESEISVNAIKVL